MRLKALDDEVEVRRSRGSTPKEATTLLQKTEPHPEPVNGEELLSEIFRVVRRYVVLDENQAAAVVLWIAFTHAHDLAAYSAILAIESPEKRCGKTTLLSAIEALVPKALASSNTVCT
jgi:putative DNA primase/helicase